MIHIGTCGYSDYKPGKAAACSPPEALFRRRTALCADEKYATVLCLFNNESMYENADTLKEILAAAD